VLPGCDAASLSSWLQLESMLLTRSADPAWRARITKREGFPASIPGDKEMTALCRQRKQEWSDLLAQLSLQDTLLGEIAYLRLLPDPRLEDAQWDFLTALTRILTHLSSQLLLSFRRFRQVDHPQIAAAALAALGPEQEPTDLALALDHRIRHILVDEFQDTSKMQTDLLKKLTAGWEPDDGRTLFLVGDAMQSVYGFRNANVGIYLKVQEEGLGDIPLQPLTLQSNFRSQANVVQWVNQVFASAFPPYSNPSRGAVPYTHSVASNPALDGLGISSEFISYEQGQKELARVYEARQVARRVLALNEADPGASIAILVRSRTHLGALIPALRAEGIHWQATDIDRMESLPVIEDLQSLTRAVLNTGDRIAWLALLRAPWCGLSLADLQVIATRQNAISIWSSLEKHADLEALTPDGRERLQDFVRVMAYGLKLRFRCGLRQLVESLWTLLDGAAMAQTETEQASVARYLDLLEEHEAGGSLRDYPEFARQVARTFLPSVRSEGSSNVHLLTMHKAKGLEYDHVILPCLGAGSQSDDKPLLQWHERVNQRGNDRLFIAARSPSGQDDDPLYRLVRFEESRKTRFEAVRLLYIAVTRARKSAHLTATLGVSSQGDTAPPRGSLLYHIWPQLQESGNEQHRPQALEQFIRDGDDREQSQDAGTTSPSTTPIKRFAEPLRLRGRALQLIERSLGRDNEPPEASDLPEFELPGDPGVETEPAATIGVLIHQALETLVSNPEVFGTEESRSRLRQYWRLQLSSLMHDSDRLQRTVEFIELSINNCIQTPGCAWIFDPGLAQSATELPISRSTGGNLYHYVVDRTFVDGAGVRWIIDYKTAAPDTGVSEESFIARQLQLHRAQLHNYRTLFEDLGAGAIKMALLFTAIPRLVEFD
jgi:ATP-dependent exoDNAse (exonuclease V) beta subunit